MMIFPVFGYILDSQWFAIRVVAIRATGKTLLIYKLFSKIWRTTAGVISECSP